MSVSQHSDLPAPTTATEQRDLLLDIAAHELRTPITSLKGHIQLLQRRLRKQPDRESDLAELRKMVYQVERINHFIDVFLGVTHLSQDRYEIHPTVFDLTADARRIVEMINAGSSAPEITLDATANIIGEWDRRHISEALLALLMNAIKFSQDHGVLLRLRCTNGVVRVEVSDRGPGVPEDERQSIFEPYVTGSNVENSGAGLGLYVAREAVTRHAGRIGVRPRTGSGSTFWFEIPQKPPAALTK